VWNIRLPVNNELDGFSNYISLLCKNRSLVLVVKKGAEKCSETLEPLWCYTASHCRTVNLQFLEIFFYEFFRYYDWISPSNLARAMIIVTLIREFPVSSLGWNICSNQYFSTFLNSLQENTMTVPSSRPRPFISTSFPINHPLIMQSLIPILSK
jgi:hypothetical protein